jgi:hypothetical protein
MIMFESFFSLEKSVQTFLFINKKLTVNNILVLF